MKAIECTQYGSSEVLHFNEVAKPSPKADEVLIRNYATTVTAADTMMLTGKPLIGRLYLGLTKPKRAIPGFDFAGEIVAVGPDVTSFNVGDKVFGGTTPLGGSAEYVCVNMNDVLTTVPETMSYEEAAPVTGTGITAMNFLRGLAHIKKNDKVLINGASGGVGTYAVQIATHFGADVTGVCSTDNMAMVKSLGANSVVDYTKEDFTQNGLQYDIIFDTVGKSSFSACKKSLTDNGVYLTTVIGSGLLDVIWTLLFGSKKAKFSATGMLPVKERLRYLTELKELLRSEKVKTIIDKQFPLSQMAQAYDYVEKGHKKGNVIININQE